MSALQKEVRVVNRWERRTYLELWISSVQLDSIFPFAFTKLDDIVSLHNTKDQVHGWVRRTYLEYSVGAADVLPMVEGDLKRR
jgi:hypothetical protein